MSRIWLAVALMAAGWLAFRTAYQAGYGAGSAVIRAEWNADKARLTEAAAEALRASGEAYQREVARREEVERGLSTRLVEATTRGRDLADRLRDALGATRSCPLPSPGSAAGQADGFAREPADSGSVGRALADHLAACERDAQRFGELQGFLTSRP